MGTMTPGAFGEQQSETKKETRTMKPEHSVAVAVITAVASIIVAVVSAYSAKDAKNQAEQAISKANSADGEVAKVKSSSVGSLNDGQKLCRVLQRKAWRDGVIVPKDWGVVNCQDYMRKTEGDDYQLGCVYSDGVNLAKPGGSLPSPNCGWH